MKLYDAAVLALANYDEPGTGNTIRQHIERRQQELENTGLSSAQARRQAAYRVYGSKPGAYGAGLQGLIDERCWEERADLAQAYVNWGGYAYGNWSANPNANHSEETDQQTGDGIAAHSDFQHRLGQLQGVVQLSLIHI